MKSESPNQKKLTLEERQELDKLKNTIENAVADGILTIYERDRIEGERSYFPSTLAITDL
jgi:hypothetical protein